MSIFEVDPSIPILLAIWTVKADRILRQLSKFGFSSRRIVQLQGIFKLWPSLTDLTVGIFKTNFLFLSCKI